MPLSADRVFGAVVCAGYGVALPALALGVLAALVAMAALGY